MPTPTITTAANRERTPRRTAVPVRRALCSIARMSLTDASPMSTLALLPPLALMAAVEPTAIATMATRFRYRTLLKTKIQRRRLLPPPPPKQIQRPPLPSSSKRKRRRCRRGPTLPMPLIRDRNDPRPSLAIMPVGKRALSLSLLFFEKCDIVITLSHIPHL